MPSTQRKRRAMPLLTCQEKQWPSMCDWVCKVCKVCMVCPECARQWGYAEPFLSNHVSYGPSKE